MLGTLPDPCSGTSIERVVDSAKFTRRNARLTRYAIAALTVLRRVELSSTDRAEEEQDLATLDASPSEEALLEIARRRLRACAAGPAAPR